MLSKDKIKNCIKKILWIVLFLILQIEIINLSMSGIDLILMDLGLDTFFLDIEFYSHMTFGYGFIGMCDLLISRYINDLCLYIWSYKIYTGKNNWYKFLRDREKIQKKENADAYKEYLKNK